MSSFTWLLRSFLALMEKGIQEWGRRGGQAEREQEERADQAVSLDPALAEYTSRPKLMWTTGQCEWPVVENKTPYTALLTSASRPWALATLARSRNPHPNQFWADQPEDSVTCGRECLPPSLASNQFWELCKLLAQCTPPPPGPRAGIR